MTTFQESLPSPGSSGRIPAKSLYLAMVALALAIPGLAHAACYDLSKGEPSFLEGRLSARIFPGAPGFEDVQKGDTPEPGYVLKLSKPICLTGDADFADPAQPFDEVQLVPTDATEAAMRALDGRDVAVELENPMPAQTGHHHRPLVAWVKSISAAGDPTQAYGTAATTVAAFYKALEQGNGELAAGFVVPEKTRTGPFSPAALTRFYGNLKKPLELIDVQAVSATRYIVLYHFVAASGECNGRAEVETESRNGRNFISHIKALNGC